MAVPKNEMDVLSDRVLDISRLLSRLHRRAPTGIDRVELAYARHYLEAAATRDVRFLLTTPLNTALLARPLAGSLVRAAVARWSDPRKDAEDDPAFRLLRENRLAKGDALGVARIAGIQAAKRTPEWIPLCHVVPLDDVDVRIDLDAKGRAALVRATASARWTTGVEMEALVAVSAACLALYDMAKAVDRGIEIGPIRLVAKRGGRSGTWRRAD